MWATRTKPALQLSNKVNFAFVSTIQCMHTSRSDDVYVFPKTGDISVQHMQNDYTILRLYVYHIREARNRTTDLAVFVTTATLQPKFAARLQQNHVRLSLCRLSNILCKIMLEGQTSICPSWVSAKSSLQLSNKVNFVLLCLTYKGSSKQNYRPV